MTKGADIVLNSLTKSICGHSDVVMGALVVNNLEIYNKLYFAAKSQGSCPSVFDCYLALRGLKTLEVRMKNMCYNAYCVFQYLKQSPYVL